MKTTKQIIQEFSGKDDIEIEQFVYDISVDNFALDRANKDRWYTTEEIIEIIHHRKRELSVAIQTFDESGKINHPIRKLGEARLDELTMLEKEFKAAVKKDRKC